MNHEAIPGLEVTFIEPILIEPEDMINLELIFEAKIARRPQVCVEPNVCELCEEYARVLGKLLVV